MTRHTILRRWEDETGARAMCSCSATFAESDWVQRSMAIAEHKKSARTEAPPARPHHQSAAVRGGWVYVWCSCRWSSTEHGFERAEAALRAHREMVAP